MVRIILYTIILDKDNLAKKTLDLILDKIFKRLIKVIIKRLYKRKLKTKNR